MRDVCEQMYTREKPKKKHEGETQRKISTLSSTHVTQPRLNIRASARKEREEERERGRETWASFASNTKPSFSSFSLRLDSSLPDLYSTCGDRCVGCENIP